MSGSSLDGLDMACCTFSGLPEHPLWSIEAVFSAKYDQQWLDRLRQIPSVDQRTFFAWNAAYGTWLGAQISHFIRSIDTRPELVVVHGHAVAHDPEAHYSVQLGHGATISAACRLPVMTDVRSADLALGGQGAPLAHLADLNLFPGYDAYLNLGGIANVTVPAIGRAWDVGGANQLLNALAREMGEEYDDQGTLASRGQVLHDLLEKLNGDPYLKAPPPKSLDNRYVQEHFTRYLLEDKRSATDRLATASQHIADNVIGALTQHLHDGRILVTGGGAYNEHVMGRFRSTSAERGHLLDWIIPASRILEYKEALLMAYMGYLRLQGLPNCVPSYTGARSPAVNGALYQTHPAT